MKKLYCLMKVIIMVKLYMVNIIFYYVNILYIKKGLFNGYGLITFGKNNDFNKKNLPKIYGKFDNGYFIGKGKIILSDGTNFEIDEFHGGWKFGKYSVFSIFKNEYYEKKKEIIKWNGIELISENYFNNHTTSIISPLIQQETIKKRIDDHLLELYNILNTFKWIEYHTLIFKPFLESEIYPFEYVDKEEKEIFSSIDKKEF